MYSGSAASLRAAIDESRQIDPSIKDLRFSLMGSTGTHLPADQLTSPVTDKIPSNIEYYSFFSDLSFNEQSLISQIVSSGSECHSIAELDEDNTALANAVRSELTSGLESRSKSQPKNRDRDSCKGDEGPLVIRFPREISLLRNAEIDTEHALNGSSGAPPSPYLRFTVKDSSAQDTVPQFSHENTPLSQEAQLMEIARKLHRARAQTIIISASNPLDQIFLAQFLHRACPDARLVFLKSDGLLVRDIDDEPFIGLVTVTPYSFVDMSGRAGPNSSRGRTDTPSLAFYFASNYMIRQIAVAHTRVENETNNAEQKADPVTYQGWGRNDNADFPALWMTVIGSDGYYPLGILNTCASDDARFLPPLDSSGNILNQVDKNGNVIPREIGKKSGRIVPVKFDENGNVLPSGDKDGQALNRLDDKNKPLPLTCANVSDGSSAFPVTVVNLKKPHLRIYPARSWIALCIVVCFLCLAHALMLTGGNYWSPFTRDLAIQENDQPRRRSTYIHVSTAMLACMAWVVSSPALAIKITANIAPHAVFASVITIALGLSATGVTFIKTRRYLSLSRDPAGANVYLILDFVTWLVILGVSLVWGILCLSNNVGPGRNGPFFVGFSFSCRCIYPATGVSPLVPVLMLLLSWYIWGVIQTWRLRFSKNGRPWLPSELKSGEPNPYYVSDEDLRECDLERRWCLYKNITCLLIDRQVVRQFFGAKGTFVGFCLSTCFVLILGALSCLSLFRSLDHVTWNWPRYFLGPYEILVAVLFFPLFLTALAEWLRLMLVWGSLKGGLLERLENQPIRFAFSRLQGMGWMTVLREGGPLRQWRDEARCIESVRQLLHMQHLRNQLSAESLQWSSKSSGLQSLRDAHEQVEKAEKAVQDRMLESDAENQAKEPGAKRAFELTKELEQALASFSLRLLELVLIPYWRDKRTGLVESREVDEVPIRAKRSQLHTDPQRIPMELHAGPSASDPEVILAAEECLAIRYMSLIRAVLANLRYLMTFVSITFVLAIIAWNSYPFQPRQYVDWLFTALLLFLGSGVVWVFAQMHRNPILSRITDTRANELGWDFWLRIVSFGAIPVLTWLAYEFPDVGATIYRILEPGTSILK
jgi:hypothetical protein